jgi:hypothetical protein
MPPIIPHTPAGPAHDVSRDVQSDRPTGILIDIPLLRRMLQPPQTGRSPAYVGFLGRLRRVVGPGASGLSRTAVTHVWRRERWTRRGSIA